MTQAVLILVALAVVGVIARFVHQFKALRAQDSLHARKTPLGMEAVDMDRFHLEKGAASGLAPSADPRNPLRNIADRQQQLARVLNPDETHTHTSATESAIRLVKGIALHNPVVIFMNGKAETVKNTNTQLLIDLFRTLSITIKDVDVSADADMHLGLPVAEDGVELPFVYIGGNAIGGAATVLEMSQNGDLAAILAMHSISYDAEIAQSLVKDSATRAAGQKPD